MTLLETLKKSLSAAEYVLADLELRMKLSDDDSLNIGNGALDALTESIAALRSAIEQVEMEEPVGYALWMPNEEAPRLYHASLQASLAAKERWSEAYSEARSLPLYLNPQPRQWVGLTREEIERCLNSNDNTFDFAADLDEVLRQKNGG